MGASARVINLSTGQRIKRSQARNRVEQCLCVWVDEGFTVRDLSREERMTARSNQAQEPKGLVYWVEGKDGKPVAKPLFAEIPGVVFMPAPNDEAATQREYELAVEANRFAAEAAA